MLLPLDLSGVALAAHKHQCRSGTVLSNLGEPLRADTMGKCRSSFGTSGINDPECDFSVRHKAIRH